MGSSCSMVFIYNPPRVELDVIFCDDDLLVLNKPTGLLSVPGRPPEHKDCLRSRANERYPTALSVHRLDCDTSGLIIMGMTKAAHRNLSMQFEAKTTAKTYIAVVDGTPCRSNPFGTDADYGPQPSIAHALFMY
jgi:tRNA pseudouridine32 synthase / 23S rRNA pseudouridine746 synthase